MTYLVDLGDGFLGGKVCFFEKKILSLFENIDGVI
jgi:hypothetical protein